MVGCGKELEGMHGSGWVGRLCTVCILDVSFETFCTCM